MVENGGIRFLLDVSRTDTPTHLFCSPMTKKAKSKAAIPASPREHIQHLIEWMSQGVYEKDHIIAMALLCAVAGENMFLLGPPGTAKSMVGSRLKKVFKNGKSFDYLMSRFSTPDEIFGPISISRLKNDDKYERLTAGYLPEADVVFLDEIWKAGPSIQNTLLTVINEHIFHNGGQIMHTPMKVLIAASNELPAKDEGLEALWDRFLVRMVSNCIENDASFFKMLRSSGQEMSALPECIYLTDEIYSGWQQASNEISLHESVVNAIKELRKILAAREKEDGNQLRYYVSDRRWRKAFRLMQTSAYLNGRAEINLTDYILLIHSFWNDAETIPNVLGAFTSSLSEPIVRQLSKIDKQLRQLMIPQKQESQPSKAPALNSLDSDFAEYDYFYYLVENYPGGDTYFSKWDYQALTTSVRDAVLFYDEKRKKNIIHSLVASRPFDAKSQNAKNLIKIRVQKCKNGAIVDGTPYSFRRKVALSPTAYENPTTLPIYQRIAALQATFRTCVAEWENTIATNWTNCDNLFLSTADLALINKMTKDINELIKTTEVKINNIVMMIK